MNDRPRCARCHHVVTVVPETTGDYAVWCACAAVSSADPQHRGVGRGGTPEAAVQAWKNWKPAT